MNTSKLKKFAQEARTKLMQQVGAKLEFVLNTDSSELREKTTQLKKLQEAINASSKAQVIDKVAYTWFNRLMALRFMDANEYQPLGINVVTPKQNFSLPEILQEAKQGHIAEALPVNHQHILNVLDGKMPSTNPQNEAYKELLIGACNHLSSMFPFLFEKLTDYTELLLPDDLISDFSIVSDLRNGMTAEDCQEVEIIGWLYQFYISELNDELISSKKKYKKEELAPASQLFTPKWIVQYMVDNTLGQVWSEINPSTKVIDSLEFYIKPAYKEQLKPREKKSIEDVKFFEPCAGSGHILSYAFDVFYKIYEEQGYNPSEIPELIITKNLYGVDIDERAAQLASFVLLMKGRQKHRRFLRSVVKNNIQPNISFYKDFEFDNKFKNATTYGSLINVEPEELRDFKIEKDSLFSERQIELKKLYKLLGQRYDCVVTNPPYISASRMESNLKQYVADKYPEAKTDLFAAFILRCLELCEGDGLTGYMTPFVWMFISSYEKLRGEILAKNFINNLIQLEYSGFDGATVPICTFTLRKFYIDKAKGSYIRLSDFKGSKNQAPKTLEAIKNPDCGWFYTANQRDFDKIPGYPIGYWLKGDLINLFNDYETLKEIANPRKGLVTLNDIRFVKFWHEMNYNDTSFEGIAKSKVLLNNKKWNLLNKGGGQCKWYGMNSYIINWHNNGQVLKDYIIEKYNGGSYTKEIRSENLYFKSGITWGGVTSGNPTFRYFDEGVIFSSSGPSAFPNKDKINYILGFLNSKISLTILEVFSPTLSILSGDIAKLPIKFQNELVIEALVKDLILISRLAWDSCEQSSNFFQNELLKNKVQDLEKAYNLYQKSWKNKFFQLHKNEEDLNKQFIEIYGLQEELTPEVPLEDITILKEETKIVNNQLVFQEKEIFKQFISYAIGCMFGRYSLDKEGLILANQGETLEDYLNVIASETKQSATFLPDSDNIIPILDDEWFEDDIVGRFYEFLKVSFGKENFEKNLAFVEECLGTSIRKYFVKDFYKDHIKRYKKRPIYWQFSSPKGSFNVLIYMHRYTPDTLSQILNDYLVEYREKLNNRIEQLNHVMEAGSSTEQTKAAREKDKIKVVLLELQEYDRDILYPFASERIEIDLDDGVLVNYNKFGAAIKTVPGLNDKKAKDKVKNFDWINTSEIR